MLIFNRVFVLLFLHVCDDLFTVFQLLKKKKLFCQHLPNVCIF